MKNVLVSKEKYDRAVFILQRIANNHYDFPPLWDAKCFLAMPDFVKSEEDAEVVRAAIQVYANQSSPNMSDHVSRLRAQAAIDALRYRKEGGE